jgi:rhodanese-related sulfurtransferase
METETVAVTRVTPWEIKERLERGEPLWFVDARNPQAWNEATEKLPGAIRVPSDEVSRHVGFLPRDRTIITYCTGKHEASSARVAQELVEAGFRNVHPLYGGFDAWKRKGLPVEKK